MAAFGLELTQPGTWAESEFEISDDPGDGSGHRTHSAAEFDDNNY